MESCQPTLRHTPAEYHALEEMAEHRSEYFDGQILPMCDGTAAHSLISTRILIELSQRLKGHRCITPGCNLRLRVMGSTLRAYPDTSVYCDPPDFDREDRTRTTFTNPIALFEVLTPESEDFDRGTNHFRFSCWSRSGWHMLKFISGSRTIVGSFKFEMDWSQSFDCLH